MEFIDLLIIPMVIGVVIGRVSFGRVTRPELSRRLTAWAWVWFGGGLLLNCVFYPSLATGSWHELELMIRTLAVLIAMIFLALGVRRLRREPGFAWEQRNTSRWWGWVFAAVGIAAGFFVLFNPSGERESIMDGSPGSLKWLILIGIAGIAILVGRILITRRR
jgi:uncharacterized membrane protein HdeD (DUF308 family)